MEQFVKAPLVGGVLRERRGLFAARTELDLPNATPDTVVIAHLDRHLTRRTAVAAR